MLGNHAAFDAALEAMIEPFRDRAITKVVGVEARGFIFAAPIAMRLGAGFIPVRKPGKLPRFTGTQQRWRTTFWLSTTCSPPAVRDGQRQT